MSTSLLFTLGIHVLSPSLAKNLAHGLYFVHALPPYLPTVVAVTINNQVRNVCSQCFKQYMAEQAVLNGVHVQVMSCS